VLDDDALAAGPTSRDVCTALLAGPTSRGLADDTTVLVIG